jgi:hypothetical protein
MSEGNNNHATVHKGGGDADLQELEEPETLDVVIDGTSPSDYPDEGKRKQQRPHVLLAVSALVVVSVTLGVSLGLTAKSNTPSVSPQSVNSSTLSPSSSPSVWRTSTNRPSQTPSSSPPSSVNEFMNGLPSYSLDLAENDADSPQAKALVWLRDDPLYNEYELHRLYQRYALAVLYYSTNGDSWNRTAGWLSSNDECLWYQYDDGYNPEDDNSCAEASRLSFLDLNGNELDGSIPTELEFLTDLELMYLYGNSLSGTIHSEL